MHAMAAWPVASPSLQYKMTNQVHKYSKYVHGILSCMSGLCTCSSSVLGFTSYECLHQISFSQWSSDISHIIMKLLQ